MNRPDPYRYSPTMGAYNPQKVHAPDGVSFNTWAMEHLASMTGLTPAQEAVRSAILEMDSRFGGTPYGHPNDGHDTGVPINLEYGGQRILGADPRGHVHCSGVPFAVFVLSAPVGMNPTVIAGIRHGFFATEGPTKGIAEYFAKYRFPVVSSEEDGGELPPLCFVQRRTRAGQILHTIVHIDTIRTTDEDGNTHEGGDLAYSANYAMGEGPDFFNPSDNRIITGGMLV